MARPQQLQPGQINPQAKPVDTFIQPAQKSAIKVAEPQQLPATPQLNTIAQGGSTFVQGQNSFAQLADDLKKFSPVVQEAAGELGMRYVGWRMDVGEQMAMQEYAARTTRRNANNAQPRRSHDVARRAWATHGATLRG